ncbi:glycosyl transferase [Ktedonobacter sp. SOSP1-52]|uniref:glycosyltransferase family 9 protein n=1 Tax=Ktedonobacter sp. SOSP1-52 TaxID=2778366 RepID=UPI0019166ED9|nr:glycosyltransferase family 9 protein [Ktedonobacter sp. SOSP1-52]GHO70749.1 glycosyl transferase [Ktedonobacter sp. SOSP1-52]
MVDPRWQDKYNILLVRLDNLGDVLLMTPAFHAVKESLPQARLTLLTSPVGAQIGRLDPDIDEIMVYEAPWVDPWQKLPHDSQREQTMIALLREKHFDGAIIFTSFRQSALPAAYMCYLADIPLRAAASIDGPGSLLTTRHKHPEHIIHEVERALNLVGALGMRTSERGLVLQVPPEAQSEAESWLAQQAFADQRPLVVVHPGCTMPARTYPWEMYVEVINLLVEQLSARVVVTGDHSEEELVKRVLELIDPQKREQVRGAAGELSFAGLCALLQRADLAITNNTGPMHLAAAVQTPVIALFALTNPPEQWGPWNVAHRQLYVDVPCRICYSRVCPYSHECLRLVSPQMVLEAARDLLQNTFSPTAAGIREEARS